MPINALFGFGSALILVWIGFELALILWRKMLSIDYKLLYKNNLRMCLSSKLGSFVAETYNDGPSFTIGCQRCSVTCVRLIRNGHPQGQIE